MVTNDSPVTFNQAIERAKQLLAEETESAFVMLIDIKHARSRKIKPTSTTEEKTTETVLGNEDGVKVGIGTVPALPPVRREEQVVEDTPETRVDMWQRKLLDLTKRNPLLNVKTSVLRLYCPNLSELEDKLATGERFNFLSAEDTGLDDPERSIGNFLLSSGDDLHREFALEQLGRNRVVVNDTKRRMETKLVELLRKAKNDLEEGGSNTLYLSIGMLRWRETPESDKSYRAPLILLPVKLDRRSAQAPVTMRQLPDEAPLFNLTLIEMLQDDYDINLDVLRNDLPEDEFGVDVEHIWDIVREKVKEERGFIVVEEIVLGSFSFAKYLMWKDLRDRTELLKRSPFVEHLVDRPADAYHQDSNFISCDEVDQKVSPAEFFAPLNCDSSQTVAIAASALAQDFVLEGPPGTGKSETIANIICHNLAIGRKVLFVAEKMAALQVVYRRMEKVGLAHLCLELHSNKANKKSVLDQLGTAWTQREAASQSDWIERANELEVLRHHLNRYVQELHHKHLIGLSPRVIRFQDEHPLRLKWETNLQQAPIKSKSDVDALLETAKELSIAFAEVADLEPESFAAIKQTDWSNQWQITTVDLANKIAVSASQAHKVTRELLTTLGVQLEAITPARLSGLSSLAELCDLASQGKVSFALTSGGPKRVAALKRCAGLQSDLFRAVDMFGHGLKWSMLKDLDWEAWISQRDAATGLFGFFKRYSLRKTMMQRGLSKVADPSILESAVKARGLLDSLISASQEINESEAWSGIDSEPADVQTSLEQGTRALELFKECMGAFSDPTVAVSAMRRHLVEGSDFLSEGSLFVVQARQVQVAHQSLATLVMEATAQRIEINASDDLMKVAADFGVIADSSAKIGR